MPGADLRLSIDLGLQRQLDAGLVAAVRAQPIPTGRIGAAVAMDPRSGQILAIASTPSFDNNVYGAAAVIFRVSSLAAQGPTRSLTPSGHRPPVRHLGDRLRPPGGHCGQGSAIKRLPRHWNVYHPGPGRPLSG